MEVTIREWAALNTLTSASRHNVTSTALHAKGAPPGRNTQLRPGPKQCFNREGVAKEVSPTLDMAVCKTASKPARFEMPSDVPPSVNTGMPCRQSKDKTACNQKLQYLASTSAEEKIAGSGSSSHAEKVHSSRYTPLQPALRKRGLSNLAHADTFVASHAENIGDIRSCNGCKRYSSLQEFEHHWPGV